VNRVTVCLVPCALAVLVGCGGTGGFANQPPFNSQLQVPGGFTLATIASVPAARELAALPNGDLLVGTSSNHLYIVAGAEGAQSSASASVFITLPDAQAQGVALSADRRSIYAATQYAVYKIPYHLGDRSEPDSSAVKIAAVRTGPVAPNSDGDVHHTSSIVATASALFVSVGSSCNACVETDPTRATIQAMNVDGTGMHTIARRIRNAIGLAVNPATGTLWAADAGQDDLPYGHPYEFADAVTLHAGSPVDYGWPDCEENRIAYVMGANCSSVAIPRVEFPAYSTHIGAVFYPKNETGAHAFPPSFAGALFVTSHGSWHCCPATPPQVDYVPMNGDSPKTPVNWSDPTRQWHKFLWGFGTSSSTQYSGRPTGVAVGSQGSVFVADDRRGVIYRIRPSAKSTGH
jgi:glucose/arabinose dehydrogenase